MPGVLLRCSANWDAAAAAANNVTLDACKEQCDANALCVGVAHTTAAYDATNSPWCRLCTTTELGVNTDFE
eukprot:gene48961-2308_t